MTTQTLSAERVYTYKDIEVAARIDFVNGTISLIDKHRRHPKNYVFANRSVQYLNSWCDILEAMQHAICEAAVELKAHQAKEAEKRKQEVVEYYAESAT